MRLLRCLLGIAAFCFLQLGAEGKDMLLYDFEAGPELSRYERLKLKGVEAEIVEPGADGTGHCLRIHNLEPGSACALLLNGPIEVQKNLILSFDHREEIEEGYEGAYLGMSFFVEGEQWFWTSDEFSGDWRHAQVQIGKLRSSSGRVMRLGLVFSRVQLYGRVKEKTKVRGETKARITVWFDNIRLYTGHPKRTLAERTRDSYANPPMFNWPKFQEEGDQKLQYSMDETFPDGASVTVDVKWNFYTPTKPMKPGTWYWRVWSASELAEGWSDIERVTILPEAHQFTTKPIPFKELERKAHPRLLEVVKIGQPEVTAERRAQLLKSARKIYEAGVPEHPGVHVPGDPRWPTWIEWYGKVAGRITGGTGGRLERIAQYAMLTKDPQVIQWAKELALAACKWDPEGGSAMRRGDIGAHHLLRGLSSCYDACCDSMTREEREKLKDIIVQRTNQFYDSLNPFRGGGREANNHAWLQAFGLAQSGVVLLGEHEQADEWLEYILQLYVGRFLCCMGYQGDNNEGLSYWGYGLGFIIGYADMMKAVCGIDFYKHPWLNQTARFPMYCAPPGAWGVSFADSGMPNHAVRGPTQTRHVKALSLRTRDPYTLWYSGERSVVEGIVPRPPVDIPQSIHYRHIGWVVFNTTLIEGSEAVTVAMHSGKYYAGHQHPDQNHFVINAYGDKLVIDGGYYDWYGSPHFKAYSFQTIAHNTLIVNGEGQAARTRGADGKILAYFDSPAYGFTIGDASDPEIYHGQLKQFDRRVLFIKPHFAVIHDHIASSGDPAKYDWLLHAIAPIEMDVQNRRFSIVHDTAALRGRFLLPTEFDMEVETGFPVEPVNRYSTDPVPPEKYFPEWTLTAAAEKPSVEQEFLVAMQIQRLGDRAEPVSTVDHVAAENAHAVRLTLGESSHLLLFRKRNAKGALRCEGLETDGLVAGAELTREGALHRAFMQNGTSLRAKGETLFASSLPVTCSILTTPQGRLVSVSLGTPAKISIASSTKPESVLHNGKDVRVQFDAKSSVIVMELSPGTHEIAYGSNAAVVPSRSVGEKRLTVNGKRYGINGYEQRQAYENLSYWWGDVPIPRSDFYDLTLEGWSGQKSPRVELDKEVLEIPSGGEPRRTLWLVEGSHYLTILGRGTMTGIKLEGHGVTPVPALMLPKEFRPTEGCLLIEAEKTSAEGTVKGKIMQKVGASGGVAHCCWDTDGQWAEWQFDVPQAGDYELLIRGASIHDSILREVLLDGKPLSANVRVILLNGTGGWCRTQDDWRYFRAVSPKGEALRISLGPGKHTLRLNRLTGSMNIDLFAVQPAR